eukprot:TRINITY_DN38778_c0_g1_i1.p2 TRINITY_DN38778_c0_g1~~TRINITY_DN38778_c0_g1_i1.p2  ORF type:complete len:118 (+),score=30.99 TRINITY_DN38778_c0_g1_i1:223-576(+)
MEATSAKSVRLHWPSLTAAAPAALPQGALAAHDGEAVAELVNLELELRLVVEMYMQDNKFERHKMLLLSSQDTSVDVQELQPGARYFAALTVRYASVGRRRWHKTGLYASFEMPDAR